MAGRAAIKCYEYDENGKFLQIYESIQEVRNRYFNEDVGKRPLFFKNEDYFTSPCNTFIANYRIGRDKLKKEERIKNCKFCNYKLDTEEKSVEVFNLLGIKIAEFKNMQITSRMLNIPINTIWSRLNASSSEYHNTPNRDNLEFKYKK